jgi:DNA polymerase-3 subunit beta
VLVPADKLRDIVRESNDDTVAIEVATEKDGRGRHVRPHPRAGLALQDLHAEGLRLPADPRLRGRGRLRDPGGLLKRLIGQTLFAAAKETQRYAINGVLMVAKGKKLSLVSTDGRRLAMAKGDLITDKLPRTAPSASSPPRRCR